MKKTVTKEVDCCDECGGEVRYASPCMKCGAVYCYDHSERLTISLTHSVFCSGSGDGKYCKKCAAVLEATGVNELFNSYMAIAELRREQERFYKDFKRRADAAETVCAAEYRKHRKGERVSDEPAAFDAKSHGYSYDCSQYVLDSIPADDGEPVTEEWLRSIGGVTGTVLRVFFSGIYFLRYQGRWSAMRGNESGGVGLVNDIKTRGQARLLLKALGITPNSKDGGE
jgi:hypothetical protein